MRLPTTAEELIELIETVAVAAIEQSERRPRTTNTTPGTVEALDDSLSEVWVRTQGLTMGQDPYQSDNHGWPGVLPATRTGQTHIDEAVRMAFTKAGADAIHTGVENRIVLPFGEEDGQRIVLDGESGFMAFFNHLNELVGYLDATQWFVSQEGGGMTRIDPIGGLRIWDHNDQVRVIVSPTEGLQVREAVSGISGVTVRHDGITVLDPETGEEASITTGSNSAVPSPRWASAVVNASPGTSHAFPAIQTHGTGDDLCLAFTSACAPTALAGGGAYSPPGSHDLEASAYSAGPRTLATGAASMHPAEGNGGNFTHNTSGWTRQVGHAAVLRGGGDSSPQVVDASAGDVLTFSNAQQLVVEVDGNPTPQDGDLAIVHVAIASSAIPIGWTVPEGWKQLGVNAAGLGTNEVLGSGIWYRQWHTGDPTSDTITINLSEPAATTRLQATVIGVRDAFSFTSGLDVRVGGVSLAKRPVPMPILGTIYGPNIGGGGVANSGFVSSQGNNMVFQSIYQTQTFAAPQGEVVRGRVLINASTAQTLRARLLEVNSGRFTDGSVVIPGNGASIVQWEWLHGLNMDTATADEFQIAVQCRRTGDTGTHTWTMFNPGEMQFVSRSMAPDANEAGNVTVTPA